MLIRVTDCLERRCGSRHVT